MLWNAVENDNLFWMSDIVINFANSEVVEITDQAIQDSTLVFLQRSCYSTGTDAKPKELSPIQHLSGELHRKRYKFLKSRLSWIE